MNKFTKPVLASAVALAVSAPVTLPVVADVSANVALTSDYRFRGISQNDKTIAIQGGFDFEDDSGFYAGVWASSVDFQIQTLDDATAEVDIYAGYGGDLGDSGFAYDVNILHFAYPNSDDALSYDFTEITVGVSYENYGFTVSSTSDYFAGSGDATYYNFTADFEINDTCSFGAAIGKQSVEDNLAWGTPDWMDYKLAVSGSLSSVDVEFAFIDTDLSEAECFGGSDWCDGTFVFTLSKSL